MKTKLIVKILPLFVASFLFTSCQKEVDVIPANDLSGIESRTANFPGTINLPDGFSPEGIESGEGNDIYVGSIHHGGIYKADRRTGAGYMLVPATAGRNAVGLAYDSRSDYLFVAGGPNGVVYVYDATSGADVATIPLTAILFPNIIINDVFITSNAAYITNTFQPEMYRVALDINGNISAPLNVQTITLSGDFVMIPGFNANGIVAKDDGSRIIICHSDLGKLYLVDPSTGVCDEIDLGGDDVLNADGLALKGNTLYTIQNFNNRVSEVKLSGDWRSGKVVRVITDSRFQTPATGAIKGNKLYVVNAKFDLAFPAFFGGIYNPTTPYEFVAVDIR